MMDFPRGNLSMQTLRKLPTNKPSKAKTNIDIRNKPNHPPKQTALVRVYDTSEKQAKQWWVG